MFNYRLTISYNIEYVCLSIFVKVLPSLASHMMASDIQAHIESMASAMLNGKAKKPGPHRAFAKVTQGEFEKYYRNEWIQR